MSFWNMPRTGMVAPTNSFDARVSFGPEHVKRMIRSRQNADVAYSCTHCDIPYTIFTRRHHCRHCGGVFCSECSKHRVRLPHISREAVRVCAICYETKLVLPPPQTCGSPSPAPAAAAAATGNAPATASASTNESAAAAPNTNSIRPPPPLPVGDTVARVAVLTGCTLATADAGAKRVMLK